MIAFYPMLIRCSRILLFAAAVMFWLGAVAGETSPDAAQAGSRIMELRGEIARHDELYFKQAAPEISDHAYDQLKRELARLEDLYPELAPAAAGQIGDDRTGEFPTRAHGQPMLSLNKSYSEVELRAFLARATRQLGQNEMSWVVEPKYDGLAISVTYENGHLVRAVSRGNGRVGDDVTANVRAIRGLPRTLRRQSPDGTVNLVPERVELRGEIYLTYAEFNRINAEREEAGEEPFAHPRNLAAGTLKQAAAADVARRQLSIVFYGWGAWAPARTEPVTQEALHQQVRAWGLPGVQEYRLGGRADEVWAAVQSFQRERKQWPFPTDGAVVKLNEVDRQLTLGAGPAAPNWAMAYKFPPESATTQVRGIAIQVGRTGLLTPVAELAPVKLGGATISRASLHNREVIRRLDLRIGDYVRVVRAGEVVPAIQAVEMDRRLPGTSPYVFPARCPFCHQPVLAVAESPVVRCGNSECPAQRSRQLEYFASPAGVGIEGLGPSLIEKLQERGLVHGVGDLYRLDETSLATVTGRTSAARLIAAIEASRGVELDRFIGTLGIREVGPAAARALAARFRTLAALGRVQPGDLLAVDGTSMVPGIGRGQARAILEYFNLPAHRKQVADLIAAGVQPAPPAGNDSGKLGGKVFVLTGTLAHLTRAQATRLIGQAGGVVHSSVSGATDYVVAGPGAGTKLEAARKLGIPVIDEEELQALVEEGT
ncbi:MAG: NAD-dependent DNA ligase LigA [Opitutales bacterium]